MSIISSMEAEWEAIKNDATSVVEKIASTVGLHSKYAEALSLEPAITAIVNGGDAVETKVEQILKAVGKL